MPYPGSEFSRLRPGLIPVHMQHHAIGGNFRMQQFQAVLLMQQFEKLKKETAWRQENADYLARGLAEIPGIAPARLPEKQITFGRPAAGGHSSFGGAARSFGGGASFSHSTRSAESCSLNTVA